MLEKPSPDTITNKRLLIALIALVITFTSIFYIGGTEYKIKAASPPGTSLQELEMKLILGIVALLSLGGVTFASQESATKTAEKVKNDLEAKGTPIKFVNGNVYMPSNALSSYNQIINELKGNGEIKTPLIKPTGVVSPGSAYTYIGTVTGPTTISRDRYNYTLPATAIWTAYDPVFKRSSCTSHRVVGFIRGQTKDPHISFSPLKNFELLGWGESDPNRPLDVGTGTVDIFIKNALVENIPPDLSSNANYDIHKLEQSTIDQMQNFYIDESRGMTITPVMPGDNKLPNLVGITDPEVLANLTPNTDLAQTIEELKEINFNITKLPELIAKYPIFNKLNFLETITNLLSSIDENVRNLLNTLNLLNTMKDTLNNIYDYLPNLRSISYVNKLNEINDKITELIGNTSLIVNTNNILNAISLNLNDIININTSIESITNLIKNTILDLPSKYEYIIDLLKEIKTKIPTIPETSTESPFDYINEPDQKQYDLWDLFSLLLLIFLMILRVLLAGLLMIIALGSIPPSSSLLNEQMVQGLEFFKNTSAGPIGGTVFAAISLTATFLMTIGCYKIVKRRFNSF